MPIGDKLALASLLVAVLAAIPAWLAIRPQPRPSKCTYAGRVLNEETLKAIDGAKVSLDYKSYPYVEDTNKEGIYRFVIPCAGDSAVAEVRVEAEGYELYSREVPLLEKIETIRLKPTNRNDIAPRTQTPITNTPTPSSLSDSSISNPKPTLQTVPLFQDGFEQGTDLWNKTEKFISTEGRTGKGIQVSYFDKTEKFAARIHQRMPVMFKSGKTYRASTWCKADEKAICQIWLGDSGSNSTPAYEHEVSDRRQGNGKWQHLTTPPLTMHHDEDMYLYLYSINFGTSATYDDILLEEVRNP
ncbi:carbohydrate-binding protein [Allocoleopsis franciscana]|uniref:Putative carbohydrate binding protein n=1 Tax=Allocoleopsis franciscana PCC 7113 TaxID=1173027 RepID=K9WJL7_9CYAN|nr:carbohydrate-binding protein [Allocoleopsis franciscana]AFZ20575.1 putative carbohydrate binding protein [Allocoleopsis franciscana PCC 7113]